MTVYFPEAVLLVPEHTGRVKEVTLANFHSISVEIFMMCCTMVLELELQISTIV